MRSERRPHTATLDKGVPVTNEGPKIVSRLLGPTGKKVLADIITVVREVALREQQPLREIRIRPVRDMEIPRWETVVIILSFASEFDAASQFVQEIYLDIDKQIDRWTAGEQEYYWRLLTIDFEATTTPRDTARIQTS